jgi:hypothetical protein
MASKNRLLVATTICVFALTSCSNSTQVEAERTSNVGVIPTEESGADVYASAVPTDGGVNEAPTKTDPNSTPDPSTDNPTCEMVSEILLEYSAAMADEDSAAIDRVIEASLVYADPDTSTPPPGEKRVLIQCDARVHWDAGYKSDLQYYLILDSNGDMRVRWDGIENVEEG